MWIAFFQVAFGIVVLVLSSDKLVSSASHIARLMGVSPLVVGLTLVAIGTTAPEIFVSILASLKDSPQMALGNVIGSNIANIGLVAGISVILMPMAIHRDLFTRELPALAIITVLASILLWYEGSARLGGGVLLSLGILFLVWLFYQTTRKPISQLDNDALIDISEPCISKERTLGQSLLIFSISLVVLILSSNLLIEGAQVLALGFGISELVVGLTLIAVGTSLPELAVSIVGLIKKEPNIALGNIIGSNIFNLCFVLPIPGILAPMGPLPTTELVRDLGILLLSTFSFIFFIYANLHQQTLSRRHGLCFLGIYIGYMVIFGITL